MSRSYKKTPYSGDRKDKGLKRYANKRLRKIDDIAILQGKRYRKYSETWDICDYYDITPFKAFYQWRLKNWYKWGVRYGEPYPSEEEAYKDWKKWYKRK